MSIRWRLIKVLMCVSLMISKVEYLFVCLSAIYVVSWEKCPSNSCVHVLIGLFVLLLLSFRHSLCILRINPFADVWFIDIFSHSVSCPLTVFTVPFDAQTFLIFMKTNLSMFSSVACAFVSYPRKHC